MRKNVTNLRSQLSDSCTDRAQHQIFALRNSKYDFSDPPFTEDSSSMGTVIINLVNFVAQHWQSGMQCNQGAYLADTSTGFNVGYIYYCNYNHTNRLHCDCLLWEGPQMKKSETQYSGFYII